MKENTTYLPAIIPNRLYTRHRIQFQSHNSRASLAQKTNVISRDSRNAHVLVGNSRRYLLAVRYGIPKPMWDEALTSTSISLSVSTSHVTKQLHHIRRRPQHSNPPTMAQEHQEQQESPLHLAEILSDLVSLRVCVCLPLSLSSSLSPLPHASTNTPPGPIRRPSPCLRAPQHLHPYRDAEKRGRR
jgi:hypothetical protein